VLERLSQNRFVAVVGASGDGKSSLVKAGLFATLKHRHARLGIHWRTVSMRPAGSPMWSLAEALYRLTRTAPDEQEQPVPIADAELYRAALARGPHAIATVLREQSGAATNQNLLLVDQFEELFRYGVIGGETEVRTFLNQLADVIEEPPPGFHLALTMRTDFLGDCARYPRFADALNRASYLLRRMRPAELEEAIARPAELYGGSVAPDLLQRLLVDAEDEADQLPLLQHALMWLWNRESPPPGEAAGTTARPVLELADYERVGGVTGALSQHASKIYDELGKGLSPEQAAELQLAAKRVFQALAEVGDDGRVTRRPRRFGELVAETGARPEVLRQVIEAFRGSGHSFLMPPPSVPIDDSRVIDVSHEALIRRWDKVSGAKAWLAEEQADAETWERLSGRVRSFAANPRRLIKDEDEIAELGSLWDRRHPSDGWLNRYLTRLSGIPGTDDKVSAAEKAEELLTRSRRRARVTKFAAFAVFLILPIGLAGVAAIFFLFQQWANAETARADAFASLRATEAARQRTEEALEQAVAQRARADQAARQVRQSADELQRQIDRLQKLVPASEQASDALNSIEAQRAKLLNAADTSRPADVGRYTLYLHIGNAPVSLANPIALKDRIEAVLTNQGFKVIGNDPQKDDSGPGVDYFNDQDLAGAISVAAIVNSVLPADIKQLQPRRRNVFNEPGVLGVWLYDNPAVIDSNPTVIDSATWNARRPQSGWCFQQDRTTFDKLPGQRFLVNCYPSLADCRAVRNPAPGRRSACTLINLGNASWNPGRGFPGPSGERSWFQYSSDPLGAPFPQVDDKAAG
jgi:hypothetical protein